MILYEARLIGININRFRLLLLWNFRWVEEK
jgi:hypothetical protein